MTTKPRIELEFIAPHTAIVKVTTGNETVQQFMHISGYDSPAPAGSYTRTTSPDLMDGGVTSALVEEEADAAYTRTDEPCGPCDALRGVIKQAEEDCRKYRRERDGARSQAEKAERERDAAQAEAAMCQTSLAGQIRRAEKAEDRAHRAEESRPTMFAESLGGMTIWGIREARREFLEQGLTYKDVRRIVELAFTPEPEPTRPEGAEEIEADMAAWYGENGMPIGGTGDRLADHLAALGYRKAES